MINRTERNVRQKAMILENAEILFWKKGYRSTSMKDIAHACGFEPANIYYYFRNKEQLLYEVLLGATNRIYSAIKHLEDDHITSPVERLRSLIKNQLNVNLSMTPSMLPDTELKDLSPRHREEVIKVRDACDRVLCEIIHAGIDNDDFVALDEKVVTFSINCMILRTRIWFSPKGRLSSNEIADVICELVMNGLNKKRRLKNTRSDAMRSKISSSFL